MKKIKLKPFNTCQKKTKCTLSNKLVKLREDRQLLARFLVVQQSRPTMIASLQDTIGTYEFSVIPRSLFSSDGLLPLPNDKSAIIHCIEEYQLKQANQPEGDITALPDRQNGSEEDRYNICITDAMAVVQAITKATTMVYCSDFAQAFIHSITKIMSGYKEGRVIFDRYIENSLKSQTRNKRSGWVEPVRFDINDSTNIKLIPLKTFLSHIDTKAKLTEYLGKALLVKFSDSEKT